MGAEVIAISIVVLLFSVICHEVAHGWVALHFGDRTALNAGRLTLNPIPHVDPIGTILMPILILAAPLLGLGALPLFAWAKPVPVNPLNFHSRHGEIWVSLAGILTNLSLAVIFAVGYHLANLFVAGSVVPEVFSYAVLINISLAIFNLLPIPPLDGSQALIAVLPYQAARQLQQVERYGFLILISVLFFGPTRMILFGVIGGGVSLLMGLLGVRLN